MQKESKIDLFKFSLDESFNEMCLNIEQLNKKRTDKEYLLESNYRIGTFIHWIIDYYDRLKECKKINGSDKEFFSGIKFLNNALKHEKSIIKISQIQGGMTFPTTFPTCIPKFHFEFIKLNLTNKKYEHQYELYCKYIFEKDVIEICEKALKILKSIKE